jgi:hypothetical protein
VKIALAVLGVLLLVAFIYAMLIR